MIAVSNQGKIFPIGGKGAEIFAEHPNGYGNAHPLHFCGCFIDDRAGNALPGSAEKPPAKGRKETICRRAGKEALSGAGDGGEQAC